MTTDKTILIDGLWESGMGGEDGKHGVLKYTQVRSVYHSYA